MKKTKMFALFLPVLLVGCEYQSEEALFQEKELCESSLTFSSHIEEIINTNCAVAGCHSPGGISPDLSTYEKVKERARDVAHETKTLQMPPPSSGKSLSQQEIDQIACWVEQGAPLN